MSALVDSGESSDKWLDRCADSWLEYVSTPLGRGEDEDDDDVVIKIMVSTLVETGELSDI